MKNSSFIWHEVSEQEKEQIRKRAKEIIDNFSEKLEKIEKKKLSEAVVEREQCEREENENSEKNEIDKNIMFKNAPNKNKDSIIAEKDGWI